MRSGHHCMHSLTIFTASFRHSRRLSPTFLIGDLIGNPVSFSLRTKKKPWIPDRVGDDSKEIPSFDKLRTGALLGMTNPVWSAPILSTNQRTFCTGSNPFRQAILLHQGTKILCTSMSYAVSNSFGKRGGRSREAMFPTPQKPFPALYPTVRL